MLITSEIIITKPLMTAILKNKMATNKYIQIMCFIISQDL